MFNTLAQQQRCFVMSSACCSVCSLPGEDGMHLCQLCDCEPLAATALYDHVVDQHSAEREAHYPNRELAATVAPSTVGDSPTGKWRAERAAANAATRPRATAVLRCVERC